MSTLVDSIVTCKVMIGVESEKSEMMGGKAEFRWRHAAIELRRVDACFRSRNGDISEEQETAGMATAIIDGREWVTDIAFDAFVSLWREALKRDA